MQKKIARLVAALFFAASLVPGLGTGAQAQDIGPIVNAYQTSIFKVYAGTTPLGTATLIDRRGYFLTASHITEAAPDYANPPQPYSKPLTLKNPYLEVTLTGHEIMHSSPWEEIDISLIHVDVGRPEHDIVKSLKPVEPVIKPPGADGPVDLSGGVAMLGYKLADPTLQHHGFVPVGSVPVEPQRSTHFIVAMGSAFHGQSGSLAIDAGSRGVGILHGPTDPGDPNPREMKFTRMYSTIRYLENLPPGEKINHLLQSIATGKLDNRSRLILRTCDFTSLDILALKAEVERNLARYRDGLIQHFENFINCMFRRGFVDQLAWFSGRFYTAQTNLPTHQAIETAQMLFRSWESVASSGLRSGNENHMLSAAAKLYEGGLAEKFPAPDQAVKDAYLSNAFYELAQVYRFRDGLDVKKQPELDRALSASIAYNGFNFKSQDLASKVLTLRGDTDTARLAAANASAIALKEAKRVAAEDTNLASRLTAFSRKIDKGLADDLGLTAKEKLADLGSLAIAAKIKAQLQSDQPNI